MQDSKLPDDAASLSAIDALVQQVIAQVPEPYAEQLAEVSVVVDDEPDAGVLGMLGMDEGESLLGFYSGIPLTEQSVELDLDLPPEIFIFRGPLHRLCVDLAADTGDPYADILAEQVRITLLHELAHHFGMDEDQIAQLGYA